MFGLGPFEMVVIGVVAVLLFGGNLPEVARKLGGSYREFRRGLNDVQQQFRMAEYEAKKTFSADSSPSKSNTIDADDDEDVDVPSAPKFTPPS
ncbi:twin-arginine translocase TatA/TatE family subunit [Rubripirellula amarantea]|uniref:Sec-independent translocase n=1 Tax=Rubripirellula amarantea TaxID=2527999 RepID=A0A5C5WHK3_9BACT|nr:twin-arginine translocase TatA/TatE family subunit [Rubripirellula amarantea]MDA8743966.1 twin-arginine translocase TatA/TatE family subunit [Rubripirellula amarantea]TWT50284.1 sec-independent translocase [Rubripirellula amarantea]